MGTGISSGNDAGGSWAVRFELVASVDALLVLSFARTTFFQRDERGIGFLCILFSGGGLRFWMTGGDGACFRYCREREEILELGFWGVMRN